METFVLITFFADQLPQYLTNDLLASAYSVYVSRVEIEEAGLDSGFENWPSVIDAESQSP